MTVSRFSLCRNFSQLFRLLSAILAMAGTGNFIFSRVLLGDLCAVEHAGASCGPSPLVALVPSSHAQSFIAHAQSFFAPAASVQRCVIHHSVSPPTLTARCFVQVWPHSRNIHPQRHRRTRRVRATSLPTSTSLTYIQLLTASVVTRWSLAQRTTRTRVYFQFWRSCSPAWPL